MGELPLVLDASKTFAGMSELAVTQHIYEHYGNKTTTLAKMDPGYDRSEKKPLFPALTGNANVVRKRKRETLFLDQFSLYATPTRAA